MYVTMRASAQVSKTGRAEQKGTMMKAVRLHRQGGPEQLVYEDAPKPELGAGDALIRVHATGITPAELTYTETYTNCDGSARLPAIPGHEVSGGVESVAHGVTDVSIGDEVYALTSFCRDGAAAEYVAVHAADLAPKPKTIDHMQAAAVPLSALTAWQAFFDHAQLAPGERVLIHGAAGGVGSFAVQIARWHGAYVIGTASSENRDFLLRLGANEVIDYRQAQFEQAVRDVDVVLDTIGGETRERSWQVLKPTGILVSLPGPIPESEEAARGKRGGRRGVFFIVQPNREQLGKIAALIDSGAIRPVIAETIPLAKARQAFERGVAGHTRGKLVLAVDKP
jgi:NADPH:quinone reductase-like Zn-dependent oxidoreductase